jgi:hypothetical protein
MTQFYAHINAADNSIMGIAASLLEGDSIFNLKIDEQTAIKLLTGEENIHAWEIIKASENYSLVKKHTTRILQDRIDTLQLVQLKKENNPNVRIIRKKKKISIECITPDIPPVKLYITAENDSTKLKGTYELKYLAKPKTFTIEGIDDLSVYTTKTKLIISFE